MWVAVRSPLSHLGYEANINSIILDLTAALLSAAAVFMLGNELPRRVINKCKDCPNYVEDLNL